MSDIPNSPRTPYYSPIIYLVSIFPQPLLSFLQFMEKPIMNTIRLAGDTTNNIRKWVIDNTLAILSFLSIYTPIIKTQSLMEIYLQSYTKELKKIKNMYPITPDTIPKTLTNVPPKTIMVNTPVGMVAMQYELERAAFVYYANISISTKLLNVAARKYAVQFHTPHLLIRRDPEPKNGEKNDTKEKKKSGGGMHSGKNRARFAKLKSATKPKDNKETQGKENGDTSKSNDDETNTEDVDSPRFICIGRMTDMNVLRTPNNKDTGSKQNTALTFADFKKQNMNLLIHTKDKT
jgi:hypothetical protein